MTNACTKYYITRYDDFTPPFIKRMHAVVLIQSNINACICNDLLSVLTIGVRSESTELGLTDFGCTCIGIPPYSQRSFTAPRILGLRILGGLRSHESGSNNLFKKHHLPVLSCSLCGIFPIVPTRPVRPPSRPAVPAPQSPSVRPRYSVPVRPPQRLRPHLPCLRASVTVRLPIRLSPRSAVPKPWQ